MTTLEEEVAYRHVARRKKPRLRDFVMEREQTKIIPCMNKINRKNLPSAHEKEMTKHSEKINLVEPVLIMMIPKKLIYRESESGSTVLKESN